MMQEPARTSQRRRVSPRGVAEAAATIVIALGRRHADAAPLAQLYTAGPSR